MSSIEDLLKNEIKRISYLNRVVFKIGILDEDKGMILPVNILNLDGSTSSEEMTLEEIMHLTEHGTITIPPKKVLRRIFEKIKFEIDKYLQGIWQRVLVEKWTEVEIRNELILYNNRINYILIPTVIDEVLASDNVISGLLGQEPDQNYVFDLKKLKNFIKSEIFFTN